MLREKALTSVRGLIRRRRSSKWGNDRVTYQQRYVRFDIEPGQRVLDIGSGGYPFPHATVLTDRFVDNSPNRHERLVTVNMPFVVSDVHALPFRDKSFDFVYCSHVLECVKDPLTACREIMRVGKRGYIETPTLGKDTLFAWARGLQVWHVVAIGHHLCFFEYSDRQLDGIRSSLWRDRVLGAWHDPLQEIFYDNQDVFNVMFAWKGEFSVLVFGLDGTINDALTGPVRRSAHKTHADPSPAGPTENSDESFLREKARYAIRGGKMPSRTPDRTFGRSGSRITCSVCAELITPDQSEIEIEFRRRQVPLGLDRYSLHVRCLAAWEFERTKLSA